MKRHVWKFWLFGWLLLSAIPATAETIVFDGNVARGEDFAYTLPSGQVYRLKWMGDGWHGGLYASSAPDAQVLTEPYGTWSESTGPDFGDADVRFSDPRQRFLNWNNRVDVLLNPADVARARQARGRMADKTLSPTAQAAAQAEYARLPKAILDYAIWPHIVPGPDGADRIQRLRLTAALRIPEPARVTAALRFTGVYLLPVACFYDEAEPSPFCKIPTLRFFPDHSVLAGELGFDKEHVRTDFTPAQATYRGTYTQHGNKLTLKLSNAYETLTYTATISPEQLHLHSPTDGQASYQFLQIGPSAETAAFDQRAAEIDRLARQTVVKFSINALDEDGGSRQLTFTRDAGGHICKISHRNYCFTDCEVRMVAYFDAEGQLFLVRYYDAGYLGLRGAAYFQDGRAIQPVAFVFEDHPEGVQFYWSHQLLDHDEIGRWFRGDLEFFETWIHPTLTGVLGELDFLIAKEQDTLRAAFARLHPSNATKEAARVQTALKELTTAAATLRQLQQSETTTTQKK